MVPRLKKWPVSLSNILRSNIAHSASPRFTPVSQEFGPDDRIGSALDGVPDVVHVSGNTYCTREHDSLRISNGKWCWFSQGIGGRSALDYLIKVKGIPFTQAAELILGREAEKPPVFYRQKERKQTELLMPELSETTEQVEKYLYSRGIHPVIIRHCVENKLLYESAD